MQKAIIIGAQGQDGQLLTNYLVNHHYIVLGVTREQVTCSDDTDWPAIDILDAQAMLALIANFQPDEIYYLAAYHHSSEQDALNCPTQLWTRSFQINVTGLTHVLEAMRLINKKAKLFYAASCLIFGRDASTPQTEQTPFLPNDIYGISKTTGVHVCRYYRLQHQLFTVAGILYNHESILRPHHFVSQKIIQTALRIQAGNTEPLYLGDLSTEVDWGYAPNFVEAMHLALQLDQPDDFIIATGKTHSVREFVDIAFRKLGLDWQQYVKEDQSIVKRRHHKLQGDPSKLRQMTGWQPSVSFDQMIEQMLQGKV